MNPNISSAGSASGSGDALQAAIQSRQNGSNVPQLSQAGTQAPSGIGVQPTPTPQGQPAQPSQGQAPQEMSQDQASMIIQSLGERLKSISSLEKGVLKMNQPLQAPPVGGGGHMMR